MKYWKCPECGFVTNAELCLNCHKPDSIELPRPTHRTNDRRRRGTPIKEENPTEHNKRRALEDGINE